MQPAIGMSDRKGKGSWILAACIALIAILVIGIKLSHARSKSATHLSPVEIGEHALQLSDFLGADATLADPPVFIDPSYWAVNCRSEHMQIFMMLDDAGHLLRLRTSFEPNELGRQVAPIETADEAKAVAMHRLADMQMFPPSSHIALEQAPVIRSRMAWSQPSSRASSSDAWQMAWIVTPHAQTQPYRLAIVLDRRTGIPVLLWRGPNKHIGLALNP